MWWAALLNSFVSVIGSGAAAVSASYESIATVTTSASQSTLSFTSIPSTFKHLQLRIHARSNRASNDTSVRIRFNSDTASNYNNHRLYGNGATANADGVANDTRVVLLTVNAAGAPTASYSPYVVDIVDYASTTKFKTMRSIGGKNNNDASDGYLFIQSGAWRSTSAITSIELTDVISTFVDGSVISLYGIKG